MRLLLLSMIGLSLVAIGEHGQENTFTERVEATPRFDPATFERVLQECPVYDQGGKLAVPRDGAGKVSGIGIVVGGFHDGQDYRMESCPLTHTEEGSAITAGHCMSDPTRHYYLVFWSTSGDRYVTRLDYSSVSKDTEKDLATVTLPETAAYRWNVWKTTPGKAEEVSKASAFVFDDLRRIPSESSKLKYGCGWTFRERRFLVSTQAPTFHAEHKTSGKTTEVPVGSSQGIHLDVDPDDSDASQVYRGHSGSLIVSADGRTVYGMMTGALWEKQFVDHIQNYGNLNPEQHHLFYSSSANRGDRLKRVRVRQPSGDAEGRFLYAVGRPLR